MNLFYQYKFDTKSSNLFTNDHRNFTFLRPSSLFGRITINTYEVFVLNRLLTCVGKHLIALLWNLWRFSRKRFQLLKVFELQLLFINFIRDFLWDLNLGKTTTGFVGIKIINKLLICQPRKTIFFRMWIHHFGCTHPLTFPSILGGQRGKSNWLLQSLLVKSLFVWYHHITVNDDIYLLYLL